MRKRHHHHVPRRVRKIVQNDKTVLSAIDNVRDVIGQLRQLAENALIGIFSFCGGGDVGVTPGRPNVVHRIGCSTSIIWGGSSGLRPFSSPTNKWSCGKRRDLFVAAGVLSAPP